VLTCLDIVAYQLGEGVSMTERDLYLGLLIRLTGIRCRASYPPCVVYGLPCSCGVHHLTNIACSSFGLWPPSGAGHLDRVGTQRNVGSHTCH
jgi:hypothetical protein